jgi:hypothetical protein
VPPDVPLLVPEEAGADDELEPCDAAAEDEPLDPDEPLVVLVVEVVDVLAVVVGLEAAVAGGTVSGGAPEVSVAGEPPPPHAARPAHTAMPASALLSLKPMDTTRRRGTTGDSDFERLHAPPTVRAVVEVLLTELIAPVAKAQVLDRPRQLGRGGREWEELADHLQRLTGLAIDVGPARLGLDHHLASGGWRPHPVPLTKPHLSHRIAAFRWVLRGAPRRGRTRSGWIQVAHQELTESPCRPLG